MPRVSVLITDKQKEWLNQGYMNLSKFVRLKLDEEIKKRD